MAEDDILRLECWPELSAGEYVAYLPKDKFKSILFRGDGTEYVAWNAANNLEFFMLAVSSEDYAALIESCQTFPVH